MKQHHTPADIAKAIESGRAGVAEAVSMARDALQAGKNCSTLSPSELSILRLVGLGLSNQEIADSLHVATATIRTHLKHIHDKCYIQKRALLAVTAAWLFSDNRDENLRLFSSNSEHRAYHMTSGD